MYIPGVVVGIVGTLIVEFAIAMIVVILKGDDDKWK